MLIQIILKFVSGFQLTLVQVMTWHWAHTKALPEPMMTQLSIYLSLNLLSIDTDITNKMLNITRGMTTTEYTAINHCKKF